MACLPLLRLSITPQLHRQWSFNSRKTVKSEQDSALLSSEACFAGAKTFMQNVGPALTAVPDIRQQL